VPAFFNHPLKRPLDFRKWRIERRSPGVDDDIPRPNKFGAMDTKRFPEPAFDPVADHRSADRSRDGKPHPDAIPIRSRQTERREQGTGNADAVVIDESKIGGA